MTVPSTFAPETRITAGALPGVTRELPLPPGPRPTQNVGDVSNHSQRLQSEHQHSNSVTCPQAILMW